MTTTDERLAIFHNLDFEGFNKQNWELFGDIHTDDVIVEVNGERTEGIHDHIAATQGIFGAMPETQVVEYFTSFGDGDWTCAISLCTGMGKPQTKVVTVAKWRGDRVSEEYIFIS